MRNTLAIARKELHSYFASSIGFILVGLFALLYGFFFVNMLSYFVQQSMQLTQFGGGGGAVNINQGLIRPALQNMSILMLFLMPGVTMGAYAEEKRSGTIELLLTSPLTDAEIILGKFLGAMALWGVMLGVTLIHTALLFAYGRPEWKPLVTAYLGLVLMGGCFISVGLLVSSRTKNQVVAFATTFSVFLLFWIVNWVSGFSGPTVSAVANYMSIINQYDDFNKGVIDTSHLVYYLSFIGFGLFLTAKSVDSERWRG